MNYSKSPGWAARAAQTLARRQRPVRSGGTGPAAGGRVRRANGKLGPEKPIACAAKEAVATGSTVQSEWTGRDLSPRETQIAATTLSCGDCDE